METGLFEIQVEHLRNYRQARQLLPDCRSIIHTVFGQTEPDREPQCASDDMPNQNEAILLGMNAGDSTIEFARCFLRLANLPNFALDRLNRYEAMLWRQIGQILFALDALDRRKPQERRRPPV